MITILLATYNSERYIRNQLDSLFRQTYQDWILVVRDDLSTDGTVNIINEFSNRYPNRIRIIPNEGKSLKAYLNFVSLLKSVDSEYYMFCDHDDVWLPNKIELSMERMKEIEKDGVPVIVHTDMKVVDQNLNIIHDSFWSYSKLLPERTSFKEMVLCNSANGCTMLFNQKAKEVALQNVQFATMHDMLLNQSVAANNGIIYAIEEPLVLYRQHYDNVVGAQKRDFVLYLRKIYNIKSLIFDNWETWKLASHIRYFSFISYLVTKVKVFYLKYRKYA